MKKVSKIFLFFIIMLWIPKSIQGTNAIIEAELDNLNLTKFITEGEKYTKDTFEDLSIEELLKSAISGNLNTDIVYKAILKILGNEIALSVTTIGGVLAIIVIHAILKQIGESIGNNSISKIAHFVQFILIVTLVMSSFNTVIDMVRNTISNLIGYINILVPLLLSLIITSGSVVTASTLQPIILAIIVFIGNGINLYILPLILISTVLGIVSNISDKIQINKLTKMFKSGIVWVVGFVFTMFVSILSLEGTLTSSVDGLTIKGLKTASSTFIPVVGKVLGDSIDTVLRCNICYKKCGRGYWNNCCTWNMPCPNNKTFGFNYSL